jgi:hypothetical protein
MTTDRNGTIRLALILCGGAPFLFLRTSWANAALIGYLLTGLFFGFLLVGEYPPLGASSFWKAMIPIVSLHSFIVCGLVWLDLNIPAINKLPRILLGFAGIILVLEWRLSLRIIDALQAPKQTVDSSAPPR